jgi:toxin CptA
MGSDIEAVACELKYSGVGVAVLLGAAAATFALVVAMPMAPLLRASLVLYVFAAAARACRELVAPRSLRLGRTGEVHVRDAAGWRDGELREGSFVMPWLVVLRWRPSGRRFDRTLVLLPGMAPPDDLRKIRVFLRWA